MSPSDPREVHQLLLQLATRLGQVIRQSAIYGDDHPAMDAAVDGTVALAAQVLDRTGPTGFGLAAPRFVAAGTSFRPPLDAQAPLRELESYLAERGLGGVQVRSPLQPRDVLRTVRLLHDLPGGGEPGPDEVNLRLAEQGVHALAFTRVRVVQDDAAAGGAADPVLSGMRLYLGGVRAVHRLLEKGISPAVVLELNRIGRGLVDYLESSPQRLLALATPRQLVPYELRHPVHMAIISVALGHRLGLRDEALVDLAVCALLVDAGLGTVPREIREAEGRLDEAQRARMEVHPLATVQQLLGLPELTPHLRRRLVVAMEHHLGVDWQGYPRVARWVTPHPYSRIISVADGYDALRANRHRRAGKDAEAALAVLRQESGRRYDPLVVEHLDHMVRDHLDLARPALAHA